MGFRPMARGCCCGPAEPGRACGGRARRGRGGRLSVVLRRVGQLAVSGRYAWPVRRLQRQSAARVPGVVTRLLRRPGGTSGGLGAACQSGADARSDCRWAADTELEPGAHPRCQSAAQHLGYRPHGGISRSATRSGGVPGDDRLRSVCRRTGSGDHRVAGWRGQAGGARQAVWGPLRASL